MRRCNPSAAASVGSGTETTVEFMWPTVVKDHNTPVVYFGAYWHLLKMPEIRLYISQIWHNCKRPYAFDQQSRIKRINKKYISLLINTYTWHTRSYTIERPSRIFQRQWVLHVHGVWLMQDNKIISIIIMQWCLSGINNGPGVTGKLESLKILQPQYYFS